ncbi:hypothetical protein BDK51DRAFT_10829, partial [Blyttiomyces helicus]
FESAMYTFVFLWSPILEKAQATGGTLPYGYIFASFMVSIMIGSVIFKELNGRRRWSHEAIVQLAFGVAAVSLFVPVFTAVGDETFLFLTFNIFETCCGLYFPSMGTIRGRFVPEETRSTVMNVFRIPLNLIVVAALLKVASMSSALLFSICAMLV